MLDISDLSVGFSRDGRFARVIDSLSYPVAKGETLGIVGESGSGKSVHALALLGLLPQPPGRLLGGQAVFDGEDLLALPESRLRDLRGARIGVVFQDPMTALNPVLTIGRQIAELQVMLLTLAKDKTEQLYRASFPSALPDIRKGIRVKAS